MPLTMYSASVPVQLQLLEALSGILDKAEAHAKARKIEPEVLLNARLFPDMFPLLRQVQIATDFAKGAGARLAGVDVPAYEDNEKTFAELRNRLRRTIDFLAALKPQQFEGSETRDVTIKVRGQPVTFKGEPYLVQFAMPNFYFHLTAVYAILRQSGVELGKGDFVGKVPGL